MASGSNLAFQMFVFPLPAPAGSAFIAGFGAKRACWLIGLILGVLVGRLLRDRPPDGRPRRSPRRARASTSRRSPSQGFLVAPIGASLFASAAAWYRRFLDLANPNRSQRKAQPAKPQQGRGDIKRDRLSH